MNSRRDFLKKALLSGVVFAVDPKTMWHEPTRKTSKASHMIYRTVNGTPEQNLTMVIEMMGGIEKLIGSNDIVVIKPNVQWWNQGGSNLLALKTFVDLIMERSGGFNGEVVIAENCHRGSTPWTSTEAGWSHSFRLNSDLPGIKNMNDLCDLLKKRYGDRFSRTHWIDVARGSKRVFSPLDGPGTYIVTEQTMFR